MDKLMKPVSLKSLKDLIAVEDEGNEVVKELSVEEVRPEPVEQHPLLRSSSNSSSSSSLELDSSPKYKKKSNMPTKSTATPGRFRDFMSTVTDEPSEGYYNTASSMWNNRAKIFTNLKKQATDKVQSLKNQNSFDTVVVTEDPNTTASQQEHGDNLPTKTNTTSTYSGLMKVETGDIQESREDSEVNSFLQGLRGRVSDPLQSLLSLKKEEEERRREWEEQEEFAEIPVKSTKRHRSYSHTFDTRSDSKENLQQNTEIKDTPKKSENISSYKKSFAVSLSALLGGKSREEESEISEEEEEGGIEEEVGGIEKEEMNNNTEEPKPTPTNPLPPPSGDSQPSLFLILCLVVVVYFYFVYPVPTYALTVVRSFISGVVFVSLFLCIFSPGSTQPLPFKLSYLNKTQPYEVPKSLYDPDIPLKGWMNEVFSYDSDTYHISHSQSVYITLDGSTLRLQTPFKNIPKKCLYNEGNIQLSNVIHQRLYDVTFAKIYLRPPGLVKKRVWSKKYPICVEIPPKTDSTEGEKSSSKENDVLYLFGRTDRQKEEWFYRIQRCINVCQVRHQASVKVLPPAVKTVEDEGNGWGVIENHYEEDTYVASSVYNVERVNEDPLRAFQDYFVHVSRLFPDPKVYQAEKKDILAKTPDSEEAKDISEPGLGVAWLNAALGRIMFDFLRQPSWAKKVSLKIQKKLDKIRLPYFMDELKLTEMNLGSTVPLIHQISLPRLDAQGVWLEMEVTYTGTAQMTLKTKMVLTKLGKNEEKPPVIDKTFQPLSSAITDSDAEDSAESSDEDDDSTVYRMVNHMQTAVSRLDGPSLIKDTLKAVSVGNEPPSNQQGTPPLGAPPKKWMKIVDSIAKSRYFQRATENDYIRRKLETVSNTPILLTVEVLQLQGTLLVNIPPPPTDRIWYGFKDPPHMLVKAHPKVGERAVKMSHITEWIEHKLKREFMKVLVLPNMDDIPLPIMFNNRPS